MKLITLPIQIGMPEEFPAAPLLDLRLDAQMKIFEVVPASKQIGTIGPRAEKRSVNHLPGALVIGMRHPAVDVLAAEERDKLTRIRRHRRRGILDERFGSADREAIDARRHISGRKDADTVGAKMDFGRHILKSLREGDHLGVLQINKHAAAIFRGAVDLVVDTHEKIAVVR